MILLMAALFANFIYPLIIFIPCLWPGQAVSQGLKLVDFHAQSACYSDQFGFVVLIGG